MLDSLVLPDHDAAAGLEAVTSAATAAFKREVEKAYARGFMDALDLISKDAVSHAAQFRRVGGVAAHGDKGSHPADGLPARSPRRKVTARARPGEIGRGLDELFKDGKSLTIKEAHDALLSSGLQASREGVARELRDPAKYGRRDDRRYFFLASNSGEEPGAGAPGFPSPSTT